MMETNNPPAEKTGLVDWGAATTGLMLGAWAVYVMRASPAEMDVYTLVCTFLPFLIIASEILGSNAKRSELRHALSLSIPLSALLVLTYHSHIILKGVVPRVAYAVILLAALCTVIGVRIKHFLNRHAV